MIRFKGFITEMANTDSADVNEIQLGYFLSNDWKNFVDRSEAQTQLQTKRRKVGDDEYNVQTLKAKDMADEVLKWARANGYVGGVVKVWWTARPGVLASAVGREVDSRKNPTDILVQFKDGQFLGLSAKSTKTQGDIGFKNPGLGTIEKKLGKMDPYAQNAVDELMKKHGGLSKTASSRKREIRANKVIAADAEVLGTRVLNQIRDDLYDKLSKMDQSSLMDYILDDWMDAKAVYPRYIKITGMRTGAKVEDPLANSKISALTSEKIKLSKVGNDSVGIEAGQKRIMKMRAKYESQKLATSIKFSGDPWK